MRQDMRWQSPKQSHKQYIYPRMLFYTDQSFGDLIDLCAMAKGSPS